MALLYVYPQSIECHEAGREDAMMKQAARMQHGQARQKGTTHENRNIHAFGNVHASSASKRARMQGSKIPRKLADATRRVDARKQEKPRKNLLLPWIRVTHRVTA